MSTPLLTGGISTSDYSSGGSSGVDPGLISQLLTGAVKAGGAILPGLLSGGTEQQPSGYVQPYSASYSVPVSSNPQPVTGQSPAPIDFQRGSSTQPVSRSRPTETMRIGGKEYNMEDLLASSNIPGAPGVPGLRPIASDASGGAGQPPTGQPGSSQPLQSQTPMLDQQDLEPAFSSSPVASKPLTLGTANFGDRRGNAQPLPGQDGSFSYPLGNDQQLPEMQKMVQKQGEAELLKEVPPELKKELNNLYRARAYYEAIVNQPSPYEKAKQFYANGGVGTVPRLLAIGASMASGGRAKSRIPLTLAQYVTTPAFKNQQSMFDDAMNKYHQISGQITELQKQLAMKRVDLREKALARQNVPASVKISALQKLMEMPTYKLDEQGQVAKNAQGLPEVDPMKLMAIDLYIAAGLIDPAMRKTIMFTYPRGAQLQIQKDALDVAHKKVMNVLDEENKRLHNQKLAKAIDIDMKLKQLLLDIRKGTLTQQALTAESTRLQMDNVREDNQRAQQRLELDLKKNKEAIDSRLNDDRLKWARIAGLDPKKSAIHGFTPEAIRMAKNNQAMIDLYQSGKLNYLLQAFQQVTGISGGYGALIGWKNQAKPEEAKKVEELALQIMRKAEGAQ